MSGVMEEASEHPLRQQIMAEPPSAAILPDNSSCTVHSLYLHKTSLPMMDSSAVAGPSRPSRLGPPPTPSTSGDSDSTVPQPVERGLEVGLLKELARSALIESLNDVGLAKSFKCVI